MKLITEPISGLFGENNGAEFSHDRKHRYCLWRIWDESLPRVMFIGLNPSIADQKEDDPTIRSCIRIAKANGYGGLYMMNCWTYISTDPSLLKIDPMSEEWNNHTMTVLSDMCKDVVFAWGSFKVVRETGRDKELMEMFPNAKALAVNRNGSPKHPLYCKADTRLIDFVNNNQTRPQG